MNSFAADEKTEISDKCDITLMVKAVDFDNLYYEHLNKDMLLKDAEREARSLAMSLWRQYYQKESPNFELCDSAAGIITQINNMIAGIIEGYTTQQTLLKEMAGALKGVLKAHSGTFSYGGCSVPFGERYAAHSKAVEALKKYHEQEDINAK